MSNGIVVLSGKEEYVNGVKEYLEKLCLQAVIEFVGTSWR